MRNPPRTTIINRIITLNEQRLIGPLGILKVPTMIWIRLHSISFALTVWIDQCSGDKITVRHGMGVRKGKRISEDGLDGTPNLQQRW
jgi:hypothetical protein